MCLIRLEGQVGFCGPVSLTGDGGGLETVSLRANRESLTSSAAVGYNVVWSRHGGAEVTVHSAVQVSYTYDQAVPME